MSYKSPTDIQPDSHTFQTEGFLFAENYSNSSITNTYKLAIKTTRKHTILKKAYLQTDHMLE